VSGAYRKPAWFCGRTMDTTWRITSQRAGVMRPFVAETGVDANSPFLRGVRSPLK
jgi:hypothetical protein